MLNFWIRLKQRKFNEEEWENNPSSRKYFYEDIIRSKMLINKSASECEKLLGVKNRDVLLWSGIQTAKMELFPL